MCGGVRGVGAGGVVSSAYCLMYKLSTMKITNKQLQGILNHCDSPYIRGVGFMFIRYAVDPKDIWSWYKDYMYDEEVRTENETSLHRFRGEYTRLARFVMKSFPSDKSMGSPFPPIRLLFYSIGSVALTMPTKTSECCLRSS